MTNLGLSNIASYLIISGLSFIGLSYIIVYNIWLRLSCLILLLAIVGAIVITSKNSGLTNEWKN